MSVLHVTTVTWSPFARYVVIGNGQSNMNNFFSAVSLPIPAATSGTAFFDGSTVTSVPEANGLREFLNELKSATGKDCIALNGAVNGVPIVELTKGYVNGYYEALLAQIQAVRQPGDAFLVLWDHGEGDTGPFPPSEENTYKGYLEGIRSALEADLGVANLPLFIGALGYCYEIPVGDENFGTTDLSWHRIQQALFNAGQEYANIHYSHNNIANTHVDGFHYDGTGQGYQGKLFAQSVKAHLGLTTGAAHWETVSAATVNGTTTDVTLAHVLGTDFTPTTGITAFEASGDNGGTWITALGARTSATTIRLTHASIPTSTLRLIRYQYGQGWGQINAPVEPDQTNTVRDNSALTVPLTPTTWDLRPSALSALPVLTHRYRALLSNLSIGATVPNLPLGPEPVRKMVVIGIIGDVSVFFVSGTVTPNVGSAVPVSLVKRQGSVGVYQAILGADAATATHFQFDAVTTALFGGRSVVTVDTVPYADLVSTTATTGGASATSNTAATATVNASAGGFIFALGSNDNADNNSGTFTGTEAFAQRNNNGYFVCSQKADASNVAANASSSVTVTYSVSGNIDLALASWR